MCRDGTGHSVAVEIKRRGEIDGVEQLTRYLELLNRDSRLSPVQGIFAAQEIKLQARTLAEDRGIRCVTLDYERCAACCRRTPCSDGPSWSTTPRVILLLSVLTTTSGSGAPYCALRVGLVRDDAGVVFWYASAP